jgi:hypothetical protein
MTLYQQRGLCRRRRRDEAAVLPGADGDAAQLRDQDVDRVGLGSRGFGRRPGTWFQAAETCLMGHDRRQARVQDRDKRRAVQTNRGGYRILES